MSTKVYNVTRRWSGSVPQCPRRYIMSPGHGVGAFLNVHERYIMSPGHGVGAFLNVHERYIMSPGHGVGAFLNVHEGI